MSPTRIQLARYPRIQKKRKWKAPAFKGAPHRKGVVYKITQVPPRKPNSAKRTIAKVRLTSDHKRIFAKVPGIGESGLQNHSLVLVRGHGPKDTPGVNYHLVRGLFDFTRVEAFGRKNARSKYGLKNFKTLLKIQQGNLEGTY